MLKLTQANKTTNEQGRIFHTHLFMSAASYPQYTNSQEIILMTTETLTLNPLVHLAALLSGGLDPNPPVDASSAFSLELSPKKPSYGYDDEEEDGYDDEEDDEEDEDDDDEEGDDYSYDDEDEEYDDEEDEDDEDDDDDHKDNEDEDEDIGYYTRPLTRS